jgi:uncharacterized protein YlxW (UPF0749 family)
VTVAVVAVVVGLLFSASARLGREQSRLRQPTDLAALVQTESDRVARLTEQVDSLRSEVDDLAAAVPVQAAEDPDLVQREGARVGTIPVTGPGLRVQLDDAPPSNISIPGVTVDDLVVHQQDLQHVINALWAGGAEAMTLQGERVIMTSAFRCSGNILLLHGKVFSPPYVIEAVGDTRGMRRALDDAPGVQRYLEWAQSVGLGWNVREASDLRLPAYTGTSELRFASLPVGTDPLR